MSIHKRSLFITYLYIIHVCISDVRDPTLCLIDDWDGYRWAVQLWFGIMCDTAPAAPGNRMSGYSCWIQLVAVLAVLKARERLDTCSGNSFSLEADFYLIWCIFFSPSLHVLQTQWNQVFWCWSNCRQGCWDCPSLRSSEQISPVSPRVWSLFNVHDDFKPNTDLVGKTVCFPQKFQSDYHYGMHRLSSYKSTKNLYCLTLQTLSNYILVIHFKSNIRF